MEDVPQFTKPTCSTLTLHVPAQVHAAPPDRSVPVVLQAHQHEAVARKIELKFSPYPFCYGLPGNLRASSGNPR
jgi:hypothetical protein